MRPVLYVVPLLSVLAACAGNPETGAGSLATSTDAASVPQQAALPRPTIANPDKLKGLPAGEVAAALGRPSFTRRDTPAEIWQYRVRACTLDLFLYDGQKGKTVDFYAVRSTQPISDQDCLSEVQSSVRGLPSS